MVGSTLKTPVIVRRTLHGGEVWNSDTTPQFNDVALGFKDITPRLKDIAPRFKDHALWFKDIAP